MCLGIPGKIVKVINNNDADVDFGGVTRRVRLDLVPGSTKGEYVIVHAGFAIKKISKEHAKEVIEIIKEYGTY